MYIAVFGQNLQLAEQVITSLELAAFLVMFWPKLSLMPLFHQTLQIDESKSAFLKWL